MNGPRALPDRGEPHGLVGQHFGQVQPWPRHLTSPLSPTCRTSLPGAASLPKARQVVRAAPADRPPVRFTWIARSDGNETDTLGPRRGAGRPEDQRLGPQAEAT